MIYSRQRETVMNALSEHRVHPTADELFTFVRSEDPGISLATVYRNLNQLVEVGRVMRIPFPGGADRFDPVNDGHYHMACKGCGQIEDIPRNVIPDVCEPARLATGLSVTESHIVFYGLCNKCAALEHTN